MIDITKLREVFQVPVCTELAFCPGTDIAFLYYAEGQIKPTANVMWCKLNADQVFNAYIYAKSMINRFQERSTESAVGLVILASLRYHKPDLLEKAKDRFYDILEVEASKLIEQGVSIGLDMSSVQGSL